GIAPGLIRLVVQQAHQAGRVLHHRDVCIVVDSLEQFADVLDRIDVFHMAIAPLLERLRQRLTCPHMPRPRRRGKNQHAPLAAHRPGLDHAITARRPCADPKTAFAELPVQGFANPRSASGIPETRDSAIARPAAPTGSSGSCPAILPDAAAKPLPAIPPAPGSDRSDTWQPPRVAPVNALRLYPSILLKRHRLYGDNSALGKEPRRQERARARIRISRFSRRCPFFRCPSAQYEPLCHGSGYSRRPPKSSAAEASR